MTFQTELPLTQAKKRGLIAAQACADAAERLNPGWVEKAHSFFWAYAQVRGDRPFTTEDVRVSCEHVVPVAPDARAWGSIAQRLKREGKIVACGFRGVVSSNGSPKVLWKLNPSSQ